MSEFDNWKEEQERIHNDYDAENAWYAGQQSQQAKLDLLEKELTETQAFLNKQNHIKQAKIDELQARIDDASNKIDFWVGGKNGDAIHVAKSVGNILKGNKDEN